MLAGPKRSRSGQSHLTTSNHSQRQPREQSRLRELWRIFEDHEHEERWYLANALPSKHPNTIAPAKMRQAAAINALPQCNFGEIIKGSLPFSAPEPSRARRQSGLPYRLCYPPAANQSSSQAQKSTSKSRCPRAKKQDREKNERNVAMSLSHMCNEECPREDGSHEANQGIHPQP